jgi:small neutral amino acid transporter SnatA (MarC family)
MTRIDFSDDFSHNLLRLVNFVFIVFIVIFAALNKSGGVAQVVRALDSYPPRRTRVQEEKRLREG